jgi:hypothetical protein
VNDDALPVTELYDAREQGRTRAYLESVHGTIPIDISEEGLAKSADNAAASGLAPGKITTDFDSSSEQVRDRAQKLADQPAARQVADKVLREFTGLSLDDFEPEGIQKGTVKNKIGLGLGDPLGSAITTLARQRAKEAGLDDKMTEEVAGVLGVASSVLFPMGGAKKAGKALKEGAAAAKFGTNTERVAAAVDVKTVMKNLNVFNAERLAASRKTVTHADTIAASQGLPPLEKGHVRLFRAEGPGGRGPEGKDLFGDRPGMFFGTREGSSSYAQQFSLDNIEAKITYLDVPAEDAAQYKVTPKKMGDLLTPGGEWIIPPDVAARRRVIEPRQSALSLEDALALPDDVVLPAEKMTALRDHYNAAATYLSDLAKRVVDGDTAAAGELPTMFLLAGELAAKDEAIGRNVARGLESRKILSQAERAPLDLNRISEMASTLAGVSQDMDPEVLAARLTALSKTERATFVRQAGSFMKAGQDAIYEAWINALLSGPQTHVANVVSNGLTTFWAVPERLAAATLDVGALGGHRSVYFGETGAMLYGAIEGVKDGIRLAGRAMREGQSQFGPDKVEHAPSIGAARWGLDPESGVGAAVDYLGTLVRMPSRFLMTEDTFFKAVNYRMELRALAYREAAAEGLEGGAFAKRVAQITADPPPAVKARAEQFALTQTFNRELSDLGAVGGAGQAASGFAKNFPLGRLILPFVRTPTNILHYASERTPVLNLISDTMRSDLAAGGARRAEALGKIGAGGSVSAVVATYAGTAINAEQPVPYMTMVTGDGPRDPKQRATLQRLGWQPYSIWNPHTNEYVSYRRTDPLGTVLGIVATATEMMGQLPEHGATEVATATAIATSKAMLSKTFLTGLSDFLETMQGNAGDFNRFAQGLARSGVPTGVRQLTRAIEDPIRKDMDSLFDHWRSGLPGYDGPAEVNLWGDPIMLGAGLGPDLVSPIYTSEVKPDAVDEYLAQNRIGFARTPRVVAGTPPPGVRLEVESAKEGVKLTKEERHRLGVLIGKGGSAESIGHDLGPLAGTPPLKDQIRTLINGPGTDGPEGSKADIIRGAVNDRKAMALMQLRRESPQLDEELSRRERARIQTKLPTAGLPATLGR